MPSGLFYFNSLGGPFPTGGVAGYFLSSCFKVFLSSIANSIDLDQTSHPATYDLGLHCLPMPFLWDARHKCVKRRTDSKLFPLPHR